MLIIVLSLDLDIPDVLIAVNEYELAVTLVQPTTDFSQLSATPTELNCLCGIFSSDVTLKML